MSSAAALAPGPSPSGQDGLPALDQSVLESIPMPAYVCAANGRVVRFNSRAGALWGRTSETGDDLPLYGGALRLFTPDGMALPVEHGPMATALRTGEAQRDRELMLERPDGSRIVVLSNVQPLKTPAGRVQGAICCFQDITARRQNELALRAQTARLDSLNRIARSLSHDLDLQRIVQTVTDTATELAGAQFGAFFYNVASPGGEGYRLYALSGAPREAFDRLGAPRNTALFEATFRGQGIVRCADVRSDPRYGRSAPDHGMPAGHLPVTSYLAVPVVSRSGEVLGGLFFGHAQAGVFTAETEELVSGIAAHAAIALDNARLLQSAQREVTERRRAEQGLQQLAAIIESSDDAIISIDLEGDIVSWNEGARRLYGYAAAEAIGQPASMVRPPGHEDEERRILERIRRGERVEPYETVRRHRDGHLLHVSLSVSPVRDAEGRIVGASKIARDISDRRRAILSLARRMEEQAALYRFTDALQRAESQAAIHEAALEAIVDALGCERASILLFDKAGVMRFVAWRGLSEAYRRAVEGHSPWTADTADPRPIAIDDVSAAQIEAPLRAHLEAEGIGALAFIPLVSHGRLIGKFMTYYRAPHAFTAGELDLSLTIGRQLRFGLERLRAVEALRAREAELETIIDRTPFMLTRCSRDLRFRFVSRGYAQMIGRAPEEVAGRPIVEVMGEEGFRTIQPSVERVLRGERVEYEAPVPYRSVGERFVHAVYTPDVDHDGTVKGWIASILDITEHKQAEAQRDLMVAELSHRVKNTLATVVSIARQSFPRLPAIEEARRSFDARIRALAQTHSRLAEANWSGVSLQTLILDELAPYRNESGTNVRVAGPPVSLTPRCAVTLGMAMHELATNAAKHGALSARGGVVEVSWQLDTQAARLCIRWVESDGPPVAPPERSGFGRLLLERALASDLRGEVRLRFAAPGVECELDLPMDGNVAARS